LRNRQTQESQANLTAKQREQSLNERKSVIPGLQNIPDNYFISSTGPSEKTSGVFGVGLLKPNPIDIGEYSATSVNPQGKPNFVLNQRVTWEYFFIEYDNQNTTPLQGKIKNFSVIKTLNLLTTVQVSKMLGSAVKNVTGLTKEQYDQNSFIHPQYTNSNGQPLSVRYAEIAILVQRTPGRLDDIPIGYPNFDSTPDGVTTSIGPVQDPMPPIV
jgi:hypothetical protein